MANNKEEQISALVDGELQGADLDRVLDALRDDAALGERWGRYHLISDALRNNLPDRITTNLHQRVAQALEAEPVFIAPAVRRRFHMPAFVRQAAGLAMAASVTAVAILGAQSMNRDEGAGGKASVAQGRVNDAPSSARDGLNMAVNRQGRPTLDPYLVNHNEYSVSSGMQGMLPYVRLVGQNSD